MKTFPFVPQAACIPFRTRGELTEILLIRWANSEDWGVPKGVIEDGNTARQTALIEAFEEAGIEGDLLDKDLGGFAYEKGGRDLRVRVYAMRVRRELDEWDEKNVRERQWYPAEKAAKLVSREPLRDMIRTLVERIPWAGD